MRISRPRVGWVAALLLLWQLGALITVVGPAAAALGMTASAPASGTTAAPHCHGEASAPMSSAHHHPHPDRAPPCCELAGACGCACAQAPAFLPSIAVAVALPRELIDRSLLESRPLTQRPTELFRPPI